MEKQQKISGNLFYLLIIIEIFILVLLGLKRHDDISFQNEKFYSINDGWTYIDESGTKYNINLPTEIETGSDNTIVISRKLPEDIHHLANLGILTSHQGIRAYINNEMIYESRESSYHGLFDIPTGNIWRVIPLPPHSDGQIITLKISSEYRNYAGKINEIQVGSKSALLIHNIMENGIGLIISHFTFFYGILIILTYYFLNRLIPVNKSSLFLGWFTILFSIQMIMNSNLTQFFISNEYVLSAITYLSLIAFPIPILLYLLHMENYHYKNLVYGLTHSYVVSAFLFILLQTFNIFDFMQTVMFVYIEILLIFIVVFTTLLLECIRHKSKEFNALTVSLGVLFSFGILEMLTSYLGFEKNAVAFSQIGFILFTIILAWDKLKHVAEIIKLSASAKHYKFLATRDLLSNCRNRVCYIKDMERVNLDRNITIFIADMNNMKQINDTYGHHIGDEVIVLCGHCLLKVFGRRVYRIGGDEFVSIQYDLNQNRIDALLEEFQNECEAANEDIPYSFHMSVGYAVFDKSLDKTIYDTVKRADKDMYERKNRMKEV